MQFMQNEPSAACRKFSLKKTLLPLLPGLCSLLLALSPAGVTAAEDFFPEGTTEAEAAPVWYQVEVIIFSNATTIEAKENWSRLTFQYPPRMLTIGPELDENIIPGKLSQLKILNEYQQLMPALSNPEANTAVGEDFLFDNLSMTSSGKEQARNSLSSEDLLAGMISEPRQEETQQNFPQDTAILLDNSVADLPNQPKGNAENQALSALGQFNQADTTDLMLDNLFQQNLLHEVYRSLPQSERTLSALASRIKRSSRYHLLHHEAWRQPIPALQNAIPILVQAGQQYDDYFELDGYVTLSRARYLHIDTNLWLTDFAPRSGQDSIVMPDHTLNYSEADRELLGQYPVINDFESRRDNFLPVQSYQMTQSRRMRSSTLHFVDHPAFGLLIKVDEFKFPETEVAELELE